MSPTQDSTSLMYASVHSDPVHSRLLEIDISSCWELGFSLFQGDAW